MVQKTISDLPSELVIEILLYLNDVSQNTAEILLGDRWREGILSNYSVSVGNLDLFKNLKILNYNYYLYSDIYGEDVEVIKDLPDRIEDLSIENHDDFPDKLPKHLKSFTIYSNTLHRLPKLPLTLVELNCSDCELLELPELPPTLEILDCSDNVLEELPKLPKTLIQLYCDNNDLRILPPLKHTSLEVLWCYANRELRELPKLPKTIERISIDFTKIKKTPKLIRLSVRDQYASNHIWND